MTSCNSDKVIGTGYLAGFDVFMTKLNRIEPISQHCDQKTKCLNPTVKPGSSCETAPNALIIGLKQTANLSSSQP